MIEVYHLCCDKIMLVGNIHIDIFSPVCLFLMNMIEMLWVVLGVLLMQVYEMMMMMMNDADTG